MRYQLTIVISFCAFLACAKNYDFRLLKIVCENINPEVQNISCEIRNYGTPQNGAFINIYTFRPLNDLLVHFEVWKKYNGLFIPSFVNVTINVCRLMGNKEHVPFHASVIMKWVRQYASNNLTCPFLGPLYIQNLRPDNFKVILPKGEYRLDSIFYEKTLSSPVIAIHGYGRKI